MTDYVSITVNGDSVTVGRDLTVSELLTILGYKHDRVAVEIDGEICPRTSFPDRSVEEGTSFEIVTFVGGG